MTAMQRCGVEPFGEVLCALLPVDDHPVDDQGLLADIGPLEIGNGDLSMLPALDGVENFRALEYLGVSLPL